MARRAEFRGSSGQYPARATHAELGELVPGSHLGIKEEDLPDPERHFELRHVPLNQIDPHEELDEVEAVYRTGMSAGTMPPLVGKEKRSGVVALYDGAHRYAGAALEGHSHVPVYVYPRAKK